MDVCKFKELLKKMHTIMNYTVAGKNVGVLQQQEKAVDMIWGDYCPLILLDFFFLNWGLQGELLTNSLWAGTVLLCGGLMQWHPNPWKKAGWVLEEIFFPVRNVDVPFAFRNEKASLHSCKVCPSFLILSGTVLKVQLLFSRYFVAVGILVSNC